MCAQRHENDMSHEIERELVKRLGESEAARRPAEIVLAGRRYRLVPVEDVQTTDDPFKDYDPERALAAIELIEASSGGLKGLDVEAFLDEIMESREQNTPGHRYP
jgi:hypothetical protein